MTRRLLIVEDDAALAATLTESFARRGYDVRHASSTDEGIALAQQSPPDLALVDLKLPGRSGLECVQALAGMDPAPRIVVLTGFASIATAVEAIKLGATNYLTKPANTDDIEAAFARTEGDAQADLSTRPTSIKTLEWEHIHQTLADTGFNVSEAARRLGLHRRTLARKLDKRHMP